MLRGLLYGSVSALALCTLVLGAASLVAPRSEAHRPATATPAAPVLREQAGAVPRRPDALPRRGSETGVPGAPEAGAPAPPSGTAPAALSTPDAADVPTGTTGVAPAEAPAETPAVTPGIDRAATVPLPGASAFNRPREDGEVVTPAADPVARPAPLAEGQRVATSLPRDGLPARTRSAVRPPEARVTGFGADPQAGQEPVLPRVSVDATPPVAASAPPTDAPRPAVETATAIDTGTAAPAGPAPIRQADPRPGVAIGEAGRRLVPPPAATPRRVILDSAREATPAEAPTRPDRRALGTGALEREAAAFANPGDLPLLAIVLIADGASAEVRADVASLGFPVTLALDPTAPGAAAAARAYRAAGHEVVMRAAPLAPGGTAQDIEVAMAAARAALPQALGVLDGPEGAFAGRRGALAALLPALSEAGMGFLAPSGGLGAGIAAARRAGVPAAAITRMPDGGGGDGTDPAGILRALSRASLEAARTGGTVVVAEARPATLAALRTWRQGPRARSVAAAPVSAVLAASGP